MNLWAELGGPKLRWGRLGAFIRHLPLDAALNREVLADKHSWGLQEVLLERLLYVAQMDYWRNSDPKRRGPAPKPPVNPWAAEIGESQVDVIAAKKADLEARDRARRGVG